MVIKIVENCFFFSKWKKSRSFFVHGLKRSGNHAVINWLMGHNSFNFYNNVIPVGAILCGTFKQPEPVPYKTWIQEQNGELGSKKKLNIVSFEDNHLDNGRFTDRPENLINIIILRSPENLFSSRIKKAGKIEHPCYPDHKNEYMNKVIEMWKEHARECLGQTNVLENSVCVLYDLWYTNEAYRKELSSKLGFKFSDKNFSKIADFGGGSSFSGNKIDSNESINVLNRSNNLNEKELALLNEILEDGTLNKLYVELVEKVNSC